MMPFLTCPHCQSYGPQTHIFCTNCGVRLPPKAAIRPRATTGWRISKWILGLTILLIMILALATPDAPRSVDRTQAETGNAAHDMLASLDSSARNRILSSLIGEGCVGDRSFFQGFDPKSNAAFWSVGCSGGTGKSYAVTVDSNATGSTRVLDCEVLMAVAKVGCFQSLKD